MTDEQRLRRTIGAPGLQWLVERVRTRMAAERPLVGVITKQGATKEEREAVTRLLGRTVGSGDSLSVSLDAINTMLRASGIASDGLAEAVVVLRGPVTVSRVLAEQQRFTWAVAHDPLRTLGTTNPLWQGWTDSQQSMASLRRTSATPNEARAIATEAALVLAKLPADGVSLPVLANAVLGDAHALDAKRTVSRLVLSAIRTLNSDAPSMNRRALWQSVGVALDELSSTVLVHALPYSSTNDRTALPHYLTLQQLNRLNLFDRRLDDIEVFVCENPSVVAVAADIRSHPIVCVRGQPSAAAVRLLTDLHSRGASIRYHGDFDWGGIHIANGLYRRFAFIPWRYETADYERLAPGSQLALKGGAVGAEWDPLLAEALVEHGVTVEEEAVLAELANDLRRTV